MLKILLSWLCVAGMVFSLLQLSFGQDHPSEPTTVSYRGVYEGYVVTIEETTFDGQVSRQSIILTPIQVPDMDLDGATASTDDTSAEIFGEVEDDGPDDSDDPDDRAVSVMKGDTYMDCDPILSEAVVEGYSSGKKLEPVWDYIGLTGVSANDGYAGRDFAMKTSRGWGAWPISQNEHSYRPALFPDELLNGADELLKLAWLEVHTQAHLVRP